MPQILKEEVRERIEAAALEEFARRGYGGATMAGIAERAGIAAGGIYRYHRSKRELFDAVVPAAVVERFEALLERRVRALAPAALGLRPQPQDHADELLRFWLDHRLAVVILLEGAEGTPYARYGERFVTLLVEATIAELRAVEPGFAPSEPARFVLNRIFDHTRRMLAAILAEHAGEPEIREAVRTFWSYQIPGLRGFADHVRGRGG